MNVPMRAVARSILALTAVVAVSSAACSGPPTSPAPSTEPSPLPSAGPSLATAPPAPIPLRYVALGDSWPEGAHCGSCRTFAGRYADGLQATTGKPVVFVDLTGSHQPFFDSEGGGSRSLLDALRRVDSVDSAVAAADVVLIATGPNESARAFDPLRHGRCGGPDGLACVRGLERFWERNFDAILDRIDQLRAGRPTAIRLVNAGNPFIKNPEMDHGLPPGFAAGPGAAIFQALTDAVCRAAAAHHAICVDVRRIINGPPGRTHYPDEESTRAHQRVANALLRTGLPELTGS